MFLPVVIPEEGNKEVMKEVRCIKDGAGCFSAGFTLLASFTKVCVQGICMKVSVEASG